MTYISGTQGGAANSISSGNDVALNNLVDGNVLTYDSGLQKWVNTNSVGGVSSVAGKTGAVTLVKGDVGLSNVDNTSDVNKPVSTAQQTAITNAANTKADQANTERVVAHNGTAGGFTRDTGWFRHRIVGGTTRPTNMIAGDVWEYDA